MCTSEIRNILYVHFGDSEYPLCALRRFGKSSMCTSEITHGQTRHVTQNVRVITRILTPAALALRGGFHE